ncbi:sensor histidine kinase [Marinirhabdus gelatinilytica]|uniref:histidine kinase n=1 Tax=Marinirhabdus gelatinilytica TaxID=1703343 RepID=A0A370QBL3_9FLAO|nr:ATP-binding protein [Marinirhabdus gelatinilytica]RDK85400.1 GAF sensor signal transduction histidine kinase [Marinirhabdus gelatinilytica]
MISPQNPENETERLKEVKSYSLLDTLPEQEYDDITELIANICDTPISLVTLLDSDRNFLKSHYGVPFNESPRAISFCGHAILEPEDIFVVEDARMDPRFAENPLVKEHNAIFYAGAPLRSKNGYPLGTLCIFDTKPRTVSKRQKTIIVAMAQQVVKLFELHRNNILLENNKKQLEKRNEELKNFAAVVSHDLKSPLGNITSLAKLLREEYKFSFDEPGIQYLDYIEESSLTLNKYIDGMLGYYKSDDLLAENRKETSLLSIYEEIEDILFVDNEEFKHPTEDVTIKVNRSALLQIFLNLVGNALKYNHNEVPHVSTTFSQDETHYIFTVQDNGIGIDKEKQEVIFQLFKTVGDKDRHGEKGSGIGLATVLNLVTKLGGTISLESKPKKGTTFTFTILK